LRVCWTMAARAGNGCASYDSWWSVSAPCRETALHGASSNGHTESVKALLEKGADVNAANNFNRGFLFPVSEGPCMQWLVRDVMESMSAPCRDTALHLASRNGHTESVKALLETGATVNAENKDRCVFFLVAWVVALRACKGSALFDLVESVGAMQGDGAARRIFQWPHGEREGAAREGRRRARREQRQVRVFLVACVAWAMSARAGKGCALYDSWWSVSAPCRHTALHLASRNGHTESVKALLETGAAVNAENKDRCAFFLVAWAMASRAGKGFAAVRLVGGACRRHAGTRRCISHLGMATRRA
jgi:hypothetical protein